MRNAYSERTVSYLPVSVFVSGFVRAGPGLFVTVSVTAKCTRSGRGFIADIGLRAAGSESRSGGSWRLC